MSIAGYETSKRPASENARPSVHNGDSLADERAPLLTDHVGRNSYVTAVEFPETGGLAAAAGDHERSGWRNGEEEGQGQAVTRTAPATIERAVLVLLIGVFTSNADGSLVLATHPIIASEFNSLADSSWLFISFALAGAATQTVYAKLSDIYGRKMWLLVSYFLFAVGCALVGLGQSYWQVILGRVVSGSGGAGMTVLAAVLITDLVPLREVAKWQGYLNVMATIGRSLGGPLGGWLADTVGWRWSFFGQAPLFLAALALCWWILPDDHHPIPTTVREAEPLNNKEPQSRLARIDFLGATLLGLSILMIMLPLEVGGEKIPWTHPLIFILFGTGAVLLALFVATEAWWAKEPVFPLVLLRQRDVVTSYGVMAFQLAAQVGLMYSVPLYFQVTANASNTEAGAHLFPAVAGNAVGGILSGILIHRTGRYKGLILFSGLCSGLSYLVLMLRWHGHTNWWESMEIIPGGFGTGIAQSAVFISLQATVDPTHKAAAASGLFLTWPIGLTVGLAIISALMLNVLRSSLDGRLIALGISADQRRNIIADAVSSVDYLKKINGDLLKAVVASYVDGLWWGHGVSLACSLLAFFSALWLREHKLKE